MPRLLHGRERELAAIAEASESARSGQASAVALVGEPGIGKSRLTAEAARRASGEGFLACWGHAWEAGGAPAYWPWRLLFESLPNPCAEVRALASIWGRAAQPGSSADPQQARFALFDAVASALRAASVASPLLCVLEDLHAADLPSLELADFVTRSLRTSRLLWIMTWRDAEAQREPARDPIARIARQAMVLPLQRLSSDEAGRLIAELAAGTPPEVERGLFRLTGGNPLFLLETLASMLARGGVPSALEELPLADGVAAMVDARVAQLTPAARRALDVASVLGRELSLEPWAGAADVPSELLRERAVDLCRSGMLLTSGEARWIFSHELVRRAILRNVPEALARASHRRLAEALDARIAAGEAALAGERAHHGLLALGEIAGERVLHWVIEASDQARAQCAYEEALAILERAQARLAPAQRDAAQLSLAFGRSYGDLGRVVEARAAFRAAIAAARLRGDARLAAEAVLGYGARYVLGDILDELIELIDAATAALAEDERELRARLLARRAAALIPAPRPAEVLAMAREALAMVASSSDAHARLEVAVAAGSAFADFAHPRERVPVNQELVRLARAAHDPVLALRGLSRLVTDHMEAGELARADALLAERDALARALKQARFQWQEPLFRSMRAMIEGRFSLCHASVQEAEVLVGSLGDDNALRCLAVHRTWLYLWEDRLPELRAHEPHVLEALRSMPPVIGCALRALIRFRAGELDAARSELAAAEPWLPNAVNTMATLAEVAAELGLPSLVRVLYAQLVPHADTSATWGLFGLTCGAPIAALLGLLAAALGEEAAARAYFARALEGATVRGARAQRAWTHYWYGRTLITRWGERDLGVSVLEAAEREARELAMGTLPARCRELLIALSTPEPHAVVQVVLPALRLREHAGAWLLEHDGRSHLLPNLRGMPMLARLLERPDEEIHALELVSGEAREAADVGDAGELLDEQARASYRRRMAALRERLAEAEEAGQAARAEAAREELEALQRELSRALGLGGRVRRSGVAAERARTSAQRRIREAIRRIAELDPELGVQLSKSVRTGVFCVYRPGGRAPAK